MNPFFIVTAVVIRPLSQPLPFTRPTYLLQLDLFFLLNGCQLRVLLRLLLCRLGVLQRLHLGRPRRKFVVDGFLFRVLLRLLRVFPIFDLHVVV